MRIGQFQLDITPPIGIDLGGYAARTQPSTAILDPLHVRALYLENATERLLWLHADVIAFTGEFVDSFRNWAQTKLGLPKDRVLLTATHTHAGPVTVHLTACGEADANYLARLRATFERAADEAMRTTTPCMVSVATAESHLAIDRRKQASAHTDPVVTAIGFRNPSGAFLAAIANYAMHPTALGSVNRAISGDWPGYAAAAISAELPGNPIVLMTNGACGNINPPKQNVTQDEVRAFGQEIARAITAKLAAAAPQNASLKVLVETVPMPLDSMTPAQIDAAVDANLAKGAGEAWVRQWVLANEAWRKSQKRLVQQGEGSTLDIELFAVRLGPITMLAINGEIFSRFTAIVREMTPVPFFAVTYANRAYGYIPTKEAYAEGGYEVEQAHFFYNTFRPRSGSLEILADRAAQLVRNMR